MTLFAIKRIFPESYIRYAFDGEVRTFSSIESATRYATLSFGPFPQLPDVSYLRTTKEHFKWQVVEWKGKSKC